MVAKNLVATNRHIVRPWVDDDDSEMLIREGAQPRLEKLVAFFPGQHYGFPLVDVRASATADLAVARINDASAELKTLPLSKAVAIPGESVVVVGYPAGTDLLP